VFSLGQRQRRRTSTRQFSSRSLGWLSCIVLLTQGICFGEPERPGRHLPGSQTYPIIDSWVKQQSLGHFLEFGSSDYLFSSWNYLSLLEDRSRLRSPLFLLQLPRKLNLAVGVQQGLNLAPAFNFIPFQGIRADVDFRDIRIGAAWGETTQPDLFRLLSGPQNSQQLFSAHLDFPVLENGAARVAFTHFQPKDLKTSDETHSILGFELDPQWSENLNGQLSAAFDFGSNPTSGDRSFLQWSGHYRSPSWDLSLRHNHAGSDFGPSLDFFSLQGSDFLAADLNWRPTDRLQLTESIRRSLFERSAFTGIPPTSSLQWGQSVHWSPNDDIDVNFRLIQSNLESRNRTSQQFGWEGRFRQRLDNGFAWEAFRSQQNLLNAGIEQTFMSQGLGFGYRWDEENSLFARYESSEASGPLFQQQNRFWSAGFNHRFANDLGELSLGLGNYSFASNGLSNSAFTATGRAQLRLGPRWKVSAQHERGNLQERTLVELNYVIDQNQEITLGYRNDPQFFAGLSIDQGQIMQNAFYLQLRQSWGGPTEQRLRAALDPHLLIRVVAHPPGSDDEIALSQAELQLGDTQRVTTDPRGQALIVTAPGEYKLSLAPNTLSPNYEFERTEFPISLSDASHEEVEFRATAWSSMRIVTFNDEAGTGEVPVGYIPVQDASVAVQDQFQKSNALGMSNFSKLVPGNYRASLDVSKLSPGYVLTGPASRSVSLVPGQEGVVAFGVQGRAKISGQVQLRGASSLPRAMNIYQGEKLLCKTQLDGHFEAEVPAGTLRIAVRWNELGSDYYGYSTPPETVVVEPNASTILNFTGTRYSKLTVRLRGPKGPLRTSGIAIRLNSGAFVYTDDEGLAIFDEVQEGPCKIEVLQETVPSQMHFRDPKPFQMIPGEKRELWLDIQ
jgi:hypothetical protein